jgi:hypothetical protein
MVISDKIQETKPRRLLNSADVSKERARTGDGKVRSKKYESDLILTNV